MVGRRATGGRAEGRPENETEKSGDPRYRPARPCSNQAEAVLNRTVVFPSFFNDCKHPLDFLAGVDGYVHVEVRKLYPDAELPRFHCTRTGPDTLIMDYYSGRHLEDLAEGLIVGTLRYYGSSGNVTREKIEKEGKAGVRFYIKLG